MPYTETRFYKGQPATTDAALYTVPGGQKIIVKQVVIANTTATAATITLGVGTSSTAANQFVPAVSIPANTVETLEMALVLTAAETLNGLQGTSSAITVMISGLLIT
jgi:hypothetical protein